MKVLPFKIPKPENNSIVYQEDFVAEFYDKLHQHKEIQISWIVQSEGSIIIGDTISDYKKGDILVIGSNVPHVFKSDIETGANAHMLSLFFSEDSFGEDFFGRKDFDQLQTFFKNAEYGFKVTSHKKEIQQCFKLLKKANKMELFIGLFTILNWINKSKIQLLSSFIYGKNYSDTEGKRMRLVFEYSLNNFSENITLQQISSIANLSPNAFCKYFKQRTNKTYVQFLTEIRIENAAKLLLKNKDLSVAEVAIYSGFGNISNFNKKFKLLKNKTPLQYKLS